MTRVIRLALLVVVWLALWGDLSVANAASGLVVAGAIVLTFETWRQGGVVVRPLRAARFGITFLYLLVKSSLSVALTVVAPKRRVHAGIVAVPLEGCTDAVATLLANAISLTPGTLTLEVRRAPLTLFVHALDARDVDAIRADVRHLEVLAVRAFGGTDALAGLTVDDTETWRGR